MLAIANTVLKVSGLREREQAMLANKCWENISGFDLFMYHDWFEKYANSDNLNNFLAKSYFLQK